MDAEEAEEWRRGAGAWLAGARAPTPVISIADFLLRYRVAHSPRPLGGNHWPSGWSIWYGQVDTEATGLTDWGGFSTTTAARQYAT